MCACRFGACEINNNRAKPKKPSPMAKKTRKPIVRESSSDWSDSESDSCSGCSACFASSSCCSCSECNMETDSSDDVCYGSSCLPKSKKTTKKSTKKPNKNGKVLVCTDGVCEWVTKKAKKPTKSQKPVTKTMKTKKATKSCSGCR